MASTAPWTVSRLFGQLVASRQRTGATVWAIAGLASAVAATPTAACLRNARLFISVLPAEIPLLEPALRRRVARSFLPVASLRSVAKSLTQSRTRARYYLY